MNNVYYTNCIQLISIKYARYFNILRSLNIAGALSVVVVFLHCPIVDVVSDMFAMRSNTSVTLRS